MSRMALKLLALWVASLLGLGMSTAFIPTHGVALADSVFASEGTLVLAAAEVAKVDDDVAIDGWQHVLHLACPILDFAGYAVLVAISWLAFQHCRRNCPVEPERNQHDPDHESIHHDRECYFHLLGYLLLILAAMGHLVSVGIAMVA